MIKALKATLLAATFVCGLAAPARAADLYDQPGTATCTPNCLTSHIDQNGYGFAGLDNFTLTDAAIVTGMRWEGTFIDPRATTTAGAPNFEGFLFLFVYDDAGIPGGALAWLDAIDAADVTLTKTGSGFHNGTVPVDFYSFHVDFTFPFYLDAGTYWLLPFAVAENYDPYFAWGPATTNVDGQSYYLDNQTLDENFTPDDRAFALEGFAAPVPEPASWALMIAGMGLVGATMRRRFVPLAA